jgi:hypothetical protein
MANESEKDTGRKDLEATIEHGNRSSLTGSAADSSRGDSAPRDPCANVEVVAGSGPRLSVQTQHLLQTRLRAAALVLFAGFSAFWIWALVAGAVDWGVMFWTHTAVIVVLGMCSLKVCAACPKSMRRLRVMELLIFGLPAAFFAVMLFHVCELCATHGDEMGIVAKVNNTPGQWMMLIFTYTLFIPNTWRRAAVVVGVLAVVPIVLVAYLKLTNLAVSEIVTYDELTRLSLPLLLAALVSVYGTFTIGALRREAFEAKQLGQYRLKELIGAGGMGEVYLAEHQLLKRPCAIKLIHPSTAADPTSLARFEREVRATAKLTHWNTVDIYDYGHTDDGTFYYVMEYLPGLSLAELVERHGPLPPERAVYLLKQTCQALREAHGKGLVHRDSKPGNIFAAHRGGMYDVVKLLDFGLVKSVENVESLQLTQDGAIAGSPLYMSPEQAMGDHDPDVRGDIYSLGAVAYYLLAGRPPFEFDKPLKVMFAHAKEVPTPPSEFCDDIGDSLEAVVMRCLEKAPSARFQNIESLIAALDECELLGSWNDQIAEHWWQESSATVVVS